MTPVKFPECNDVFGPPHGMEESQVHSIPAHVSQAIGGSCDGSQMVVVAYKLSVEEITLLANGNPLYLTMLGGLAPHFHSFTFHQATHPA